MNEHEHTIIELKALKERLLEFDDLVILSALLLTDTDLLVETNYGPLFLDEDDYKMFNFDPHYIPNTVGECINLNDVLQSYEYGLNVIRDKQNPEVLNLVTTLKLYYIDQMINELSKGEISYEDLK